ncbi:MAG TPA: hypothetical protein VGT81_21940 [Casimicrobiaceae bacterium]|nr:hypothetical protein [Casimicrobiaceae bacterium]
MINLSAIEGGRPVSGGKAELGSITKLRAILEDVGMRRRKPGEKFEAFEKRLHSQLQDVERELLGEDLARADVDAEAIAVEGIGYRRVLRASETYMTAAGPVRVERWLYKDRTDEGGLAIVPMELNAGIIGGLWTPMAAQQAAWVVSQMTPQTAEDLFARVGNMAPSKSSLDRLPKLLAERWNDDRKGFEQTLRDAMVVPAEAVTVMASLDGVLAPMKDGGALTTKAATAARGQIAKGPAGYREVGCATLSFCDKHGKAIAVVRMARMPEPHKASLKEGLAAELNAALEQRPDLRLVKAADGANDNWTFLHKKLPPGEEVVDFFHAAEHLSDALAAAYGDGTVEARRRFAELRHVLLEEDGGVGKVIRSLVYLRDRHPRRERLATELGYFRKRRKQMRYAEMKAQGLPIGTGVTEAACKTLVTQRLKQSGMRWGNEGGQAILNLRGWAQSERFDQAWALLAATFSAQVTIFNDVVSIRKLR